MSILVIFKTYREIQANLWYTRLLLETSSPKGNDRSAENKQVF